MKLTMDISRILVLREKGHLDQIVFIANLPSEFWNFVEPEKQGEWIDGGSWMSMYVPLGQGEEFLRRFLKHCLEQVGDTRKLSDLDVKIELQDT